MKLPSDYFVSVFSSLIILKKCLNLTYVASKQLLWNCMILVAGQSQSHVYDCLTLPHRFITQSILSDEETETYQVIITIHLVEYSVLDRVYIDHCTKRQQCVVLK